MSDPLSTGKAAVERILIRGVNWLGDAVMSIPALLRLREARPRAHLALLTHEKLAGLWQNHPAIDRVFTFSDADGVWSIARIIRAGTFHVGVAFPNSQRSAFELWLGRVPRRVGYAATGRGWLLTERVRRPPGWVRMRKRSRSEILSLVNSSSDPCRQFSAPTAHQMNHYLHLVAELGANHEPVAPRLSVTDEEMKVVRQKFGLGIERPLLGLNAGAEYGPAKRWPAERFIEAASELQKRTGGCWVLFGSDADAPLSGKIRAALKQAFPSTPPIDLAGKTTLRELCAVLRACRVLLSNDTGPAHLAAAVGTPVVTLFGSTSPELTGPGLPGDVRHRLVKSDVPCSPCFLRECPIDFRCMHGISVNQVARAVLETLASQSDRQE
jgi:heptosyltransferase-2